MPASITAPSPEAVDVVSSANPHPARKPPKSWIRLSPVALGYVVGPVAFVAVLVLVHFGLVVRQPAWLWMTAFALVLATSIMADHLYRRRPTDASMNIRIAQNVAAVGIFIYLTGWGSVLVLAFVFVALENMAKDGSRVWRLTALWSVLAITAGQAAISEGWAPSELSPSKANTLAFMGAFVLFIIIRMAGAVIEQKERAEFLVRQSEDRFRSLIQNSSDVTVVVNDSGVCTYVSPSVTPMLGFDPSELVGRSFGDFMHDDDKKGLGARVRSDLEVAPENVSAQFRMHAKHGGVVLVESVVTDQRNSPAIGGFVASLRDITERTKAARDLQRTQESFRALFEQHPHPMWVYDFDTLRFLEVNECAIARYGYSRQEFLSMTIAEIRPPEDAQRLMTYLRVERPSLNYAGIWRHRTKSGEIIDVEVATHTLEFRGRRGGLVMAQDITERVRLEQQLRDHALHDPLTGLPNRSLLLDRVERLNAQAKRSGDAVTVLVLSLDNFRLINETYGHDIGDALICRVAERLVQRVPDADTVGLTGGDEFVLLAAPPMHRDTPETMAQRISDLVGSEPFEVDGHDLMAVPSIGVVAGTVDEGADLIHNAETALKLAKAEGGNRHVVFAQEMQTAADERSRLTMELRSAIGTGQFENFYQPVIRVEDLKIVGVEALVRWRHPTLGLISPAQFIPLAEEMGVVGDVGRSVLRKACEQAKLWQRKNPELTVAVNVSVFQLRTDEFVANVRDALQCSGLDPASLILEVTESILINNPQTALGRLKALKELGVRLAIDDFGTGFSSLSYLRQFPFDILKIDQSFVASMSESVHDSPQAASMVRTMIQLGRRLKLDVIAEGVEQETQLDLLRRLHCRKVQGFLFSPPVGAEAMTSLLSEKSWCGGSELQGSSATIPSRATPQGIHPVGSVH